MVVACRNCGRDFKIAPSRAARAKYCSRLCQCTAIARRPVTWGARIGAAIAGNVRHDLAARNRANPLRGAHHPNWRGGISRQSQAFRFHAEYGEWKKAVFQRDGFTCRMPGCGKRGGDLNAHHVKPAAKFPSMRFDVANGVTLCEPCHNLTKGREAQYEAAFA